MVGRGATADVFDPYLTGPVPLRHTIGGSFALVASYVVSARCVLLFCLALAALAARAAAHSPPSPFLEDLTWTEIRDAVAAGKTTILVPIGGTEQNGPHMAVGKHNARARLLAQRIAAGLGNALVAPVVAYVPEGPVKAAGHMRFPGTITIPEEAFEETLESAARSFRLHGFLDVVFLGDHGGYRRGLERVAARLNREWAGTKVRAHAAPEYYRAEDEDFSRALEAKGYGKAEIGTHAGLADTALTLALDPALVRADRLAAGAGPAQGVHGDPARASAELGRIGVDLVVERTVQALRKSTAPR